MNLVNRPRRLRTSPTLRSMMRETRMSPSSLIYPIFAIEGENIKNPIASLPGQFQWSPDRICEAIEECIQAGVEKVMLFGLPAHKDEIGSGAWAENGIVQQAIRAIKAKYPDFYVITDVCMCEYTSHGHCGILCDHYVDNDKTLECLAKIALSHAQAGADMVAPSDMMDGRVAAIRKILDDNGFINIPIMAYSAKYASAFYGPFRDAAGSAPSFGDRKSYQMDPHNSREAMLECQLDVQEGADIIMVKPALSYLDIIVKAKERFDLPLAAYSVSGEYAMIKAAAAADLVDEYRIMCESALSIYRAGGWKLTFSPEMVRYLKEHQKDFMPEDTKAGTIQAFLDSYTGDTVCSKQLYKEALNHAFDEPKQWEIREINEIMNQCVTGWTYFSNPRSFAGYGRQKGWEREKPVTGNGGLAAEIPDGFVEITEQMELPF